MLAASCVPGGVFAFAGRVAVAIAVDSPKRGWCDVLRFLGEPELELCRAQWPLREIARVWKP